MSAAQRVRSDRLAFLLLLAVPLAVLMGLGVYAFQKYRWASQQLADLEPRYARMLGLQQQQAGIEQALAQQRAQLGQYAYPASTEGTQAGNAALQQVRGLLTSAGMLISSAQALPAREPAQGTLEGFEIIPFVVRAEGNMDEVQKALAAIEGASPAVFIDRVNLQLNGFLRAGDMRLLQCEWQMSVLRRKS